MGKADPPPPPSSAGKGTAAASCRCCEVDPPYASKGEGTATAAASCRHCPDDFAVEAAGWPLRPVDGLQSSFLYRRWCRSVCVRVCGVLLALRSKMASKCVPVPALVFFLGGGERLALAPHGHFPWALIRSHMDVSAFTPPPPPPLGVGPAVAGRRNHLPGGSAALIQPEGLCHTLMPGGSVARVDVRSMSASAFARQYDDPCKPALLLGAMDAWPAGEWPDVVWTAEFMWGPILERSIRCGLWSYVLVGPLALGL